MRRRGEKRSYKPLFLILYAGLFIAFLFAIFQLLPVVNSLIHSDDNEQLLAPYKQHASQSDFETELIRKHIEYESIQSSSDSAVLIVELKDTGTKVYFSSYEDAQWQVNSLQDILTRLAVEKTPGGTRKAKVIDMRLSKPVVRF